tara:strand:- start:17 stop:151 length:135 start_codon:yes stop_codon:yes gene_type:complete
MAASAQKFFVKLIKGYQMEESELESLYIKHTAHGKGVVPIFLVS